MSTSLLYWQQGIRVYRHQKIERLKGGGHANPFFDSHRKMLLL